MIPCFIFAAPEVAKAVSQESPFEKILYWIIPLLISGLIIPVVNILAKRGVFDNILARDKKPDKTLSDKRSITPVEKAVLDKHKVFMLIYRILNVDLISMYKNSERNKTSQLFVFMLNVKFSAYDEMLKQYLEDVTVGTTSHEEHIIKAISFINEIDMNTEVSWDKLGIPKFAVQAFNIWSTNNFNWVEESIEKSIRMAEAFYTELDDFLDALWFILQIVTADSKARISTFNGSIESKLVDEIMHDIKWFAAEDLMKKLNIKY